MHQVARQVLRCLVLMLVVALLPVAAIAGSSLESTSQRQITMGASPLIFSETRSARDIRPEKYMGAVYDPNRTFTGKKDPETAPQMQDLQKSLDAMIKNLKDGDPSNNSQAWSGSSSHARTALKSLGIDDKNWEYTVPSVILLPRRVDKIKAIDHSRGGESQLVYETQNRPYTENYTEREPVYGPIGCGCRGSELVGYRNVDRTRIAYRPTTVPVAMKTPVVDTSEILTPFDATKTITTARQVSENYVVRTPVWAPVGCGCRGQELVGYRNETHTRMTTVYDTTTIPITAFEHHLPQKFSAKGAEGLDGVDNRYLAEGSYTPDPAKADFVTRKTDDNGSLVSPTLDAADKAREMAEKYGNDDRKGDPINPRGTAGKGHP